MVFNHSFILSAIVTYLIETALPVDSRNKHFYATLIFRVFDVILDWLSLLKVYANAEARENA